MQWAWWRKADKDPLKSQASPQTSRRSRRHRDVTSDPGFSTASGGWSPEKIDTAQEAAEALDQERALHLGSVPTIIDKGQKVYAIPTHLADQVSPGFKGRKTLYKGQEVYLVPVEDVTAKNAPEEQIKASWLDTHPAVKRWSPFGNKGSQERNRQPGETEKYRGDGDWS